MPASRRAPGRALYGGAEGRDPFEVLSVLTRATLVATVTTGLDLPVRIEGEGGGTLAESAVRLPLSDSKAAAKATIGSMDGGNMTLRILNATDRQRTIRIDMPSPPEFKLSVTSQCVEVAAGAEAGASFPVPPQAFGVEGLRLVPYRVAVADGSLQDGEISAELRIQSRWWVSRRIKELPKLEAIEDYLLTLGHDVLGGNTQH